MELMNPDPQRYERIDLHTHSTWSDGALSPAELVALAATRQVQLLALTDHDTVAGCPEAAAACADRQIDFVPGCELTALWRDREIHIVGLELDIASPALEAHLGSLQAQRRERIAAIGTKLTKCGLEGAELSGLVLARAGTPTRAHLARLLVARGHATDVDDAFKRWLARGQRAAVSAQWPTLEATVAVIVAAGGIPVLAHPHRYRTSAGTLRELCALFRAAGGLGLEVSLAGMGPGDASQAASLARRNSLAGSSGSDFHLPGLPWRPLGRLAKLPEGVVSVTEQLGQRSRSRAPPAWSAPQAS